MSKWTVSMKPETAGLTHEVWHHAQRHLASEILGKAIDAIDADDGLTDPMRYLHAVDATLYANPDEPFVVRANGFEFRITEDDEA